MYGVCICRVLVLAYLRSNHRRERELSGLFVLNFFDSPVVNFEYFELMFFVCNHLVLMRKFPFNFKDQSGQGVCITLHFLERILLYVRDLVEIVQ